MTIKYFIGQNRQSQVNLHAYLFTCRQVFDENSATMYKLATNQLRCAVGIGYITQSGTFIMRTQDFMNGGECFQLHSFLDTTN